MRSGGNYAGEVDVQCPGHQFIPVFWQCRHAFQQNVSAAKQAPCQQQVHQLFLSDNDLSDLLPMRLAAMFTFSTSRRLRCQPRVPLHPDLVPARPVQRQSSSSSFPFRPVPSLSLISSIDINRFYGFRQSRGRRLQKKRIYLHVCKPNPATGGNRSGILRYEGRVSNILIQSMIFLDGFFRNFRFMRQAFHKALVRVPRLIKIPFPKEGTKSFIC